MFLRAHPGFCPKFCLPLAALLLCLALPAFAPGEPVTPQEALKIIESESIFIIDVRGPKELESGFYPASHNIPMPELEKRLNEIPRDTTVLIHCAKGVRAKQAEKTLNEKRGDLKTLYVSGQPIFE